jgi:Ca-activated chloride channel family protein
MNKGLQRVGSAVAGEHTSAGGRLVSVDGRLLPLRGIVLRGEASGGLARIVLEQRFENPCPDPLRVTYQMPLPPEAAVSGYSFQIGPRRIVGEVDRVAAARERFEQALLEGQAAGLLEQDRSSLFTQEIGNIPAGVEVIAELVIDQRLRWLEEGAWEWRFPTVVAPRYLGPAGRVPDGERVTVDVADRPLTVGASLALAIRDPLTGAGGPAAGHAPESPSHTIGTRVVAGATEVTLADDSRNALDRDLVIRWPAGQASTAVALDTGRPMEGRPHAGAAYGLLTITPPRADEHAAAPPRDLIVLLDMSGSMAGQPLDQARRVVTRLIETLSQADQLELIGFAHQAKRWKARPVKATAAARQQAIEWLASLEAGGGTEMQSGVTEALRPLRAEAQRQVVLITDGEIGFESEIVGLILRDLPAGCRLHTVGVGPAVNRTLTGGAARAGRGAEIVVGLDEDPQVPIARLVARLEAPVLTELDVSGSALLDHAPTRLPDVCAAAPVLVALQLRPEGGELRITGRREGKPWEEQVSVPAVPAGAGNPAVPPLYGRELVEDLEMRRAAGEIGAIDRRIERTGLDFQIATRLTSWVAVSEEATVDPKQATRRERIPQMVPQGLSLEGFGLGGRGVVERKLGMTLGQSVHLVQRMAHVVSQRSMMRFAPSALELRGRIVLRHDRTLVVEITLDNLLEWKPSRAAVVWSDGTRSQATIDEAGTTRPGVFHAGQVIRLVLRLGKDGPAAPPEKVLLDGGSMSVALGANP